MKAYTVEIESIFKCSLERAFKTPMLCDVTKVHTGYLLMPAITHIEDENNWGQPNGSKKVFMKKNIAFQGGYAATDKVICREENKYWKIELSDFHFKSFGFQKFIGEWSTVEQSNTETKVIYRYTLYSSNKLLAPFHWLFTKTFWKSYMKHALAEVKKMAYSEEPYLYP